MLENKVYVIKNIDKKCPNELLERYIEIGIIVGKKINIVNVSKHQIRFEINTIQYVIRKKDFDTLEVELDENQT